MLQISGVSKYYGEQVLFENASVSLQRGERLGLCGRNGTGKSTLFKMILGVESLDSGTITAPRGYTIGHLEQHLTFTKASLLEEACLGLPEAERDLTYKAEMMLEGLGFSPEDFSRSPKEFSGGFQIRINLTKLLLSEPDLLLLDEPTNYLDIVSQRWMIEFLNQWRREAIIISHDRDFMDAVTTHSMVIHRRGFRKVAGPTEKLYEQILQDEEVYEKTRLNDEKKRKELETFITRFRAKASKASLVQSKIKALGRMEKKEALTEEADLEFSFKEAPFGGKVHLEVSEMSFAYPGHIPLIEHLTCTVGRRDRIGIIGKNGKGKTTLLRLLAGELTPAQGGVRMNPNSKVGYFGQTNIDRLDPKKTVWEEIEKANESLHITRVRGICGLMMFEGDLALKKVSVLSGGERSRVQLGKILACPTNLLLLDEPTNHLDMESIDSMIDALKEYDGALILVSHSELLLRELCDRLIVFQGPHPFMFEGDYDSFLAQIGWGEADSSGPSELPGTKQAPKEKKEKKGPSKEKRKLEERILAREMEIEELQIALADAAANADRDLMLSTQTRIAEIQAMLAEEYLQLDALT